MNKTITITNLNGTEPYDIYLCDGSYLNCIFITTINDVDIPYTFLVPAPFLPLSTVSVKAIDNVGCEIKDLINI